MGFMDPTGAVSMRTDEAQQIIEDRGDNLYFDYLRGRVLKVDLSGDTFDTFLFNRDLGEGAAEAIIADLRASDDVEGVPV